MIPVPSIFRANQFSSGNWIVWLYEEREVPQWDSTLRCFITEDIRARIVRGKSEED